jgi:hypothetical protein
VEYDEDLDFEAACKRAGISKKVRYNLGRNPLVLEKMREIKDVAFEVLEASGASAMKKFYRTQAKLDAFLDEGDVKAAGALVKTHELEMRAAGLFAKDNEQKVTQVVFNIDIGNGREVVDADVIDLGELVEDKR